MSSGIVMMKQYPWHCHDEAVSLLPIGLDIFCELHPEASTKQCRIHIFTMLLKAG
jgi:hypothetical protein